MASLDGPASFWEGRPILPGRPDKVQSRWTLRSGSAEGGRLAQMGIGRDHILQRLLMRAVAAIMVGMETAGERVIGLTQGLAVGIAAESQCPERLAILAR